jgi:hypothetical protein
MLKNYDFVLKENGKTIFGNCFNDEKGNPELIVPEAVFDDKTVRQYTFRYNCQEYPIEGDGKRLKLFISRFFNTNNRNMVKIDCSKLTIKEIVELVKNPNKLMVKVLLDV